MKLKNALIAFVFLSLLSCSSKGVMDFSSPNGAIKLLLSKEGNTSRFSLLKGSDTLIHQSPLGLQLNETDFTSDVTFSEPTQTTFDETWETINGKQRTIRNHYHEYKVKVAKTDDASLFYEIIFRLYDDGLAYHYHFPQESIHDSVVIKKELTALNFTRDFTYWAYNREHHTLGPIRRSEENIEMILPPFVIESDDHNFMAIHEAKIVDFAPFNINASQSNQAITFNTDYSQQNDSFSTSWRTFILGDRIGDLVESNLLVNLNDPCKIEDTSWIKPGKSLWDWRVWGYKTQDGYTYGLNTESHKRFIDFAAENNIQNLLIDADWYGAEFSHTSDPTSAREGINIEEAMAYAAGKGVGIILYLNDIGAKKFGLEKVLKQFADWGAVGVKYGFMTGSPADKVKQTRRVVELCAKYKLMVDFHDNPIAPSGDRRTYPNLVTKEFNHAQADARRSYFPETAVNQPLVNMIAGPLDITNGWFGLNNAHSRKRVFKKIPGTVAAEVAKLITVYTGWMVLPDSPEEYLKKDDLFECVRQMPAQFDSFKVLDAKLDEFVCIARQAGNDWFVGSLTNREARSITLDLDFLSQGQKYEAHIYEDAKDSHFLNNKEAYNIRTVLVDANSELRVQLAPGGGNAIHFKALTETE